jgi:DNA-binding NarL/FixJ family response regulator
MVAEDHRTVREGLKFIVNSQDDMETVGEAGDGREAVWAAQKLVPDLVLMDISMPEINGLTATATLKRTRPEIKILALTRHFDDAYLQELIQSGASGYILKQSAPTELPRAIRHVADRGNHLDPSLTRKVFAGFTETRNRPRGETAGAALTARESETLRYIALGYSNREIAEKLDLSVKTVEAHKACALKKLSISSRREIISYAILQGWMQEK